MWQNLPQLRKLIVLWDSSLMAQSMEKAMVIDNDALQVLSFDQSIVHFLLYLVFLLVYS